MESSRDELKNALTWKLVEFARENPRAAEVEWTPEEWAEAGEILALASRASRAQFQESAGLPDPHREAVRQRVMSHLPKTRVGRTRLPIPLLVAACSVLITVVGFAIAGRLAPPAVRLVRVPSDLAGKDIDPLDEQAAHVLIPKMVRNELDLKQERNLMWHMLVCPGCHRDFVSERTHAQDAPRHQRTSGDAPKAAIRRL